MPKSRKYENARPGLKTGDIVLFSGKGGISAGIKWATLSRWSHVGMVLVLAEYDFVCLWESTTIANIKDLETGEFRKGVQLVPLSSRVQQYEGQIVMRSLQGVEFSPADVVALMALRKKLARRPFEENLIELALAAYDGPFGLNSEDLSSLFCSELVAEAYQELGLIKSGKHDKPSNEYTPADFSAKHEDLPWRRGSLGPEIDLKN
jgi:hypothetical protein